MPGAGAPAAAGKARSPAKEDAFRTETIAIRVTEEEKTRLRAMSGGSLSSLVRSLLARGDAVAKAESKILSAPSLGGVMFGAYLAHAEDGVPQSWGVIRVSADGTRRKVLGGIGRAEAIDRARVFAETLHDSDGAVTELLTTPRQSRGSLPSKET